MKITNMIQNIGLSRFNIIMAAIDSFFGYAEKFQYSSNEEFYKAARAVLSYVLFLLLFRSANYVTLVTAQLILMATHMVLGAFILCSFKNNFIYLYYLTFLDSIMKAGLGLPDIDSWNMIEKIAGRNNLGYKQLVSQTATFVIENWLL